MVKPVTPDGGRTRLRPRFPALLTQETMEAALADTSWREEMRPGLCGRLATIANRALIHHLEHFGGPTTVRFECALAVRELMLEFVDRAPQAIDDGASSAVWAAAFSATVTACQWADLPTIRLDDGVGFDRGLDDDLFEQDDEDEDDEPLDLLAAERPEWADLVRECATGTALTMGVLVADVIPRAAIVRSTVEIAGATDRWRVPSYRAYLRQGVIRTSVPTPTEGRPRG
ncbi:MAG: hypothetical protein JNM94_01555 [Phycisphaerae bacterium]|nr:hypothetical protein [Phycisphaerae bacterium]